MRSVTKSVVMRENEEEEDEAEYGEEDLFNQQVIHAAHMLNLRLVSWAY